MWLRLEDEDGKVIQAASIELRSLVIDPTKVEKVELDGQIGAKVLRLALDSGK